MSSTNRWWDRHASDYYVTPQKPVREFLQEFIKAERLQIDSRLEILDPCAWWDNKHEMTYPSVILDLCNVSVTTMDIREDSKATQKGDFLKSTRCNYDMVISNPPFSHAIEFIQKGLEVVRDWWYVVYLLRLNFLEWLKRKAFYDKHAPKYIFVHHKRMSFTDDWKTDSVAYAHFVRQKGFDADFTATKVI